MNTVKTFLACLLVTIGLPSSSAAIVLTPPPVDVYTLEFEPTQNARPESSGVMTIRIFDGGTSVSFVLRGGYPNTVYTIWTVFNRLVVPLPTDPTRAAVPSCSATGGDPDRLGCPSDARPGFPPEGSPVAPLARLDRPFTDGMGLDQGITFVTNDLGDGAGAISVEYNLFGGPDDGPPVGNKNFVTQCVRPVESSDDCIRVNVATTWLRKFIGEYGLEERPSKCANYEPLAVKPGIDPRYWQCIDPTTALPRVHRYEVDHFRLAPHPDDLTHGLFGGNPKDHFIDMVGRRCRISPPIDGPCPPIFPLPPVAQPPVAEPPATEPPATEPPATQPPATEPPATPPPVAEPPATPPPIT